ncbi:MAG: type VII secretion protein EssC [Bacilli bacterium]|nr:type VII secretion protein EssC [Bacilli bacterium]
MIIYLFNDQFFTKVNLPSIVNGMYSLSEEEKLVANILSNGKNWEIELSPDFVCDQISNSSNELSLYTVYKVKSAFDESSYNIVAIPKYDESYRLYNISDSFTMGNNTNSDIYYSVDSNNTNGKDYLKVSKLNNSCYWSIETNSSNFLLNKGHARNGIVIKNGDYIFYYGLKVVVVGSAILVNNPNSLVSINTSKVVERHLESDFSMDMVDCKVKDDEPLFKKEDYFYKAPRFNFILKEEIIVVDEPPQKEEDSDTLPAIVTVGPQVTMVATSLLSFLSYVSMYMSGQGSFLRLLVSISMSVSMILGAILWPTITRKLNKKRLRLRENKRVEKYSAYLDKKSNEINDLKNRQKDTICENYPSAADCSNIILNKKKELWQRNIDHDDFLSIRVGLGNRKTLLQINVPVDKFSIDEEDSLLTKMKEIVKSSLVLENVPISYNFTDSNISAIVGSDDLVKKFMDNVFLQMITFHSYTDLKFVVFTKEPEKWSYLKMIPHCWDNHKTIRYYANTIEDLSTISLDLEKIFDARVANDEQEILEDNGSDRNNRKRYQDFKPYYVLFIDDMSSVRNVSLINKILRYKKNMGFSIILTSESISLLPSEASNFISIGDTDSAILTSNINDNQQIFKADLDNSNFNIYESCRNISNIPVQVEKAKYDLPSSLTFLETYNVGRVEQLNCLSRWQNNNPVLSLAVPVGIDQNGEIFKMNIHEKAYGPHGLVAGTTGSGKSEWLVTLILSLAVNFSPEEVQFVIIDYKGGGLAMSFENSELGVKLPHIAGKITNLDKSEIYRSIAAIESELKRRQQMFNEAREKLKEGSMNIYKYQEYYRKGMLDEPLSHLLIICDEFAELKSQQPEFMDQLISTSRIGRSLGIHLILATQKPSGVVNDQIWSNSRFKVCFKVQEKSDSNEVIRKPDAAYLKQIGSYYLQVGTDDLFTLGQSAWSGAKYHPSNIIKHDIDDSIEYIDNIGRVIGSYKEKVENISGEFGEELINVVSYVSNSSKQLALKNRPLWLENIQDYMLLSDLIQKYNHQKAKPYDFNIIVGEYDEPRKQEQGPLYLNLKDGNIVIMGQNNSGIDELLSTIIFSSISEHNPREIAFYIIDFGAETMKKFSKFPHVGEVAFQEDTDTVTGILEMIINELEDRKNLLSDFNGSYEYYNRVNETKLPLISIVINNYDVFMESFSRITDLMNNLFRDSAKYGIIFIITGSQSAIRQRQLQFFNHLILLNMSDDSQYRAITNCRRELIPKKTLGRGICKTNSLDNDSYCEFQTAFIYRQDKELDLLRSYADKCVDFYKYKVKQLVKLPEEITSSDLIKYCQGLEDIPIGFNYYKKDVAKYNLLSQKIHVITCNDLKENMEFIYGLTSILSNIPNVKTRVIDFNKIFNKLIIDVRMFNENLNVMVAALENDVLTRNEAQDWAVNIVVGAGSYKKVLSEAGQLIFNNMFNNIINSHKTIYILADDYNDIKNLKPETWFDQIDLSNGIWVGNGLDSQSILSTNIMSQEDKKLRFDGIGYEINDGVYNVIKVVRDGDE